MKRSEDLQQSFAVVQHNNLAVQVPKCNWRSTGLNVYKNERQNLFRAECVFKKCGYVCMCEREEVYMCVCVQDLLFCSFF